MSDSQLQEIDKEVPATSPQKGKAAIYVEGLLCMIVNSVWAAESQFLRLFD